MPRRPDPYLEGAILDAAQKLWKKGGEKELTMRAIARAAGTNTPAVYRRYRDRDDILRALLGRIRGEFAALLENASSPEEGAETYLDFALAHPREYELFYQYDYELNFSPRSNGDEAGAVGRPGRAAMKRKLAEKFGGAPDEHDDLVTALWMLTHGAAMLLIAKSITPKEARPAREAFTASVKALLSQH